VTRTATIASCLTVVLGVTVVLGPAAAPAAAVPGYSWAAAGRGSPEQPEQAEQSGQPQQRGMPANDRRVIATSVEGREIVARHYGALDAPVQIVAIGQMHGSEPGGRKVIQALSSRPVPAGVGLWLIVTMNPDGDHVGHRANAHGVDLNRNFPSDWRAGTHGSFWPGRHAGSEPETRGMVRFLTRVRPTAVLSYHQSFDVIDIGHPRSARAGRQLARWMGEQARPVPCSGPCHGTLTQWVDGTLSTIAMTVELDHRVSDAEAARAATAVLRLGTWLGG
jgi:protein MpaA